MFPVQTKRMCFTGGTIPKKGARFYGLAIEESIGGNGRIGMQNDMIV